MAANSFVNSFRTAVNPQIAKQYAAHNREGSRNLLLDSTKFSFYLMLMLCIPIYLLAGSLLKLWLGVVPEYAEPFLKIAILTSLIDVFSQSFYTGLYAKGQIRENAVISFFILLPGFGLIFLLFKLGFSPISSAWVMFGAMSVISLIVKPLLLVKIVEYPIKPIIGVYVVCLRVALLSVPIPFLTYAALQDINEIFKFALIVILSVISVCASTWFAGLNADMKNMVKQAVLKKLKKAG
jgi:O-antigen/teichoic acid export membrane protein